MTTLLVPRLTRWPKKLTVSFYQCYWDFLPKMLQLLPQRSNLAPNPSNLRPASVPSSAAFVRGPLRDSCNDDEPSGARTCARNLIVSSEISERTPTAE